MMMGWTFAVIDTVSISAIKIHCNMVVDVCGKRNLCKFCCEKKFVMECGVSPRQQNHSQISRHINMS